MFVDANNVCTKVPDSKKNEIVREKVSGYDIVSPKGEIGWTVPDSDLDVYPGIGNLGGNEYLLSVHSRATQDGQVGNPKEAINMYGEPNLIFFTHDMKTYSDNNFVWAKNEPQSRDITISERGRYLIHLPTETYIQLDSFDPPKFDGNSFETDKEVVEWVGQTFRRDEIEDSNEGSKDDPINKHDKKGGRIGDINVHDNPLSTEEVEKKYDSDNRTLDSSEIGENMSDEDLCIWIMAHIMDVETDARKFDIVDQSYPELSDVLYEIDSASDAIRFSRRNNSVSFTDDQIEMIRKADEIADGEDKENGLRRIVRYFNSGYNEVDLIDSSESL